jgi:Domain of Unknown Function (DUF1206)
VRAEAIDVRGDTPGVLGRVGLLATGALYLLLGLLSLRLALEGRTSGHRPDTDGALRLVADQPLGTVLLVLLLLGFAAHAVWRLAEALGDRDREGDAPAGLAKRAGYAALALWYAALAGLTGWILLGDAPNPDVKRAQATEDMFGWPLGRELVGAVGLGLIAAAIASVVFAYRKRHLAKLHTEQMSPEARRVADLAGLAGYASRALVFALIGGFLVEAAWTYDPDHARGLDGALLRLAQAPLGSVLLAAVALGFFCYGAWSLMQARYRAV